MDSDSCRYYNPEASVSYHSDFFAALSMNITEQVYFGEQTALQNLIFLDYFQYVKGDRIDLNEDYCYRLKYLEWPGEKMKYPKFST